MAKKINYNEHSLMIRDTNGTPLNEKALFNYVDAKGRDRENKPYFGIQCEGNDSDELLLVAYFKGPKKEICIRKISADDFAKYFKNDLNIVAQRLVNVILIGIDGVLTQKPLANYLLEQNNKVHIRPKAIQQIKNLANQPYLKIELFIQDIDLELLDPWLKQIFYPTDLKTIFHSIHIIKISDQNRDPGYDILNKIQDDPQITGVANVFVLNNPKLNIRLPSIVRGHQLQEVKPQDDESHWEKLKHDLERNKINPLYLKLSTEVPMEESSRKLSGQHLSLHLSHSNFSNLDQSSSQNPSSWFSNEDPNKGGILPYQELPETPPDTKKIQSLS